MRSLVVSTFLTLDGVMQAPGGPREDPTGGFSQGGWSVKYWDEAVGAAMAENFAKPFDLLLGRKTYQIFAAHWPYAGDEERAERGGTASDVDDPAAAALNGAPATSSGARSPSRRRPTRRSSAAGVSPTTIAERLRGAKPVSSMCRPNTPTDPRA
jgi:hypothetical protein